MTQIRQATNDIKSEIQKSATVENPSKAITDSLTKEVKEVKKDFDKLTDSIKRNL